jgi:hypothetical protein
MFIFTLLLNQYGWRLFHLSLMEDGYYWVSQRDVHFLWYRGPIIQVTLCFAVGLVAGKIPAAKILSQFAEFTSFVYTNLKVLVHLM